jgi:DNA-directed RNA polymerase specialized sigma24 family protein
MISLEKGLYASAMKLQAEKKINETALAELIKRGVVELDAEYKPRIVSRFKPENSMYLPLQPDAEKPEKLRLLFTLKKLGEAAQKALTLIYVEGYTPDLAACMADMKLSNLTRSIDTLERINRTVHDIALIR